MSSDLSFNKIAGSLLATALTIVGLGELSSIVYKTEPMQKAGYAIAIQEESAGGAVEVADVPPDWGTVLPTANATAGADVANKCKSCHNLDAGGPNLTGPNLYGVEFRKPGSHPGFAYSASMTDFGAKHAAWTYDELYTFLKSPGAYISGTKMTFVGLKKPEDRVNLIAYLRTLNSSPPPIPAPNPKAAAAPAAAAGAPTTGGAPSTGSNAAPGGSTVPAGTAPPAPTAAATSVTQSKGSASGAN